MGWFAQKASIATKIYVGFLFVIFLIIILGYVSIIQTKNINDNYKNSVTTANSLTEICANLKGEFQNIRLATRDTVLHLGTTSKISKAGENIKKYNQNINTYMQELSVLVAKNVDSTITTESEISTLNQQINKYISSTSEIQRLESFFDYTLAMQIVEDNIELANNITASLEKIYTNAYSVSKQTVINNSEKTNELIIIMSCLVLFIVFIAIISATVVKNVISNPIIKLKNDAIRIANGDLNVNIAGNGSDEIAQTAQSFARVVDVFNGVNREIAGLYQKIEVEGDIESRLNTAKFAGEYKILADNINNVIDGLALGTLETINILNSYANGDFSPKSRRFAGKKETLHKALDLLQGNLAAINKETQSLIESALVGDLNERINTKQYQGDWKKLTDGMNRLLDGVIAPIRETINVTTEMSKGNLSTLIKGDYKGEYLNLKTAINSTLQTISSYVGEISEVLNAIANEDLRVEISRDYIGDFSQMKESLNLIIKSFNEVLSDISTSADQVASGARHISESSMMLAQGASEQAGAVDELTVTLDSINSQTAKNAVDAENASNVANAAKENADIGNDEMSQMLGAMKEINTASLNISKIIMVIEEIALQTNLLALNAAVEAAHAGKHGKGFTVVADQVRTLANRSHEAAKQTKQLIEGTVDKVSQGMNIANQTAAMLGNIVLQIGEISDLVGGVATASGLQADAIDSLSDGISQILLVTQTNSATSEEEAASSQQLSSQAEVFRNMVARFKLKDMTKKSSKPTISQTGIVKNNEFGNIKNITKNSNSFESNSIESNSIESQKSAVMKPTAKSEVKSYATKSPKIFSDERKHDERKQIVALKTTKIEQKPTIEPKTVKTGQKPVVAPKTVVKAEPKTVALPKTDAVEKKPAAPKTAKNEQNTVKSTSNATFHSSFDSKDFGKY